MPSSIPPWFQKKADEEGFQLAELTPPGADRPLIFSPFGGIFKSLGDTSLKILSLGTTNPADIFYSDPYCE